MSTKPHPLKIAFIGAGGIVSHAHAAAVNKHPEFYQVLGVCDLNLEAAQTIAERYSPDAQAFRSMEELYDAVGSELEGVIVGTPHFLHEPAGIFFLERGIPILMEKPVTCSLDELERLQALERPGVFVQAGQMQRFDAEALWMRDFVQDAAKFGSPTSFDLNIWQNIQGYIQGNQQHWILDGNKAGGGICISVGIHVLDLLRFVTGEDFLEVTATGRFDPPFSNQAESSCSVLFKMSGGVTGTLHASYTPSRVPYSQRMVLFGERGALYQDTVMKQYAGPMMAVSEDPMITKFADMYGGFEPIAESAKAAYPEANEGGFSLQLLHFREAILEGRKPTQNSLEINHNTIAVLDAIAASLQSGKTEAVAALSALTA